MERGYPESLLAVNTGLDALCCSECVVHTGHDSVIPTRGECESSVHGGGVGCHYRGSSV